jgi:hypothetical protein
MTPEEEIALQRRRRAALLREPHVRQAVARLKVKADASLGYETPQWVRDLAEEVLDPRLPEPRWLAVAPPRRRTPRWWRRR